MSARQGLAWFPVLDENGKIHWEANPRYRSSEVSQRSARAYPELGLTPQLPIYEQFASNPDAVQWVSEPGLAEELWRDFEP